MVEVLVVPVFRRVWFGQLVNRIGDGMFAVVLTLLLAGRDDRAAAIGLVLACIAVGGVVSLLVGSGLIDRFRRSRVIIVSDLSRACTVLAVLAVGANAPLTIFAVLGLWMGVGEAIYRPAYGALVPSLVPVDRVRPANALRSLSNVIAMIVGSALGGLAVASVGVQVALGANVATFVVSIVTLLGVDEAHPTRTARGLPFLAEAAGGARYVRRHRWQLAVMLQGTVQFALVMAPMAVLVPLSYSGVWSGRLVGLIVACEAAGALAGSVLGGTFRPARPGTWAMLALIVQVPQIIAVAVVAPPPVILPASVLTGIGFALFGVLWTSALQTGTPSELLGRVLAVDALASSAFGPVGLLVVAAGIPLVGPGPVAWAAAAVLVVSVVAVLPVRGVARLAEPASR